MSNLMNNTIPVTSEGAEHMFTRNRKRSALRTGSIVRRIGIGVVVMTMLLGFGVAPAIAGTVSVTGSVDVHANSAIDNTFDLVAAEPVITESFAFEWVTNTVIVISAPPNFQFNTTQMVTGQVIAGDIDIGGGAGMPFAVAPSPTTIQFTVVTQSTVASSIRFTNIQLRAIDCAAGTLGDAADILVNITNPPGAPANAVLVDVAVINDATDIYQFSLTADPLTQLPAADILFTITALDACNNPIANFVPPAPITLIAAGGAGTRTYSNGTLAVTPTVANQAELGVINMFDANGQGTFNATSPVGEDPLINVSANLGPASGSVDVRWITATCAIVPTGILKPVNTLHAVTCTVTQNGGTPLSGVNITFNVTAGPNMGAMALDTTNAAGQATFFYNGGPDTGIDTIQATGAVGAVTLMCDATVEWISPTCMVAAMPATQVGGMQTVSVDVESRPGVDAPDGTVVSVEVISGPNAGLVGNAMTVAGVADFMYMSNGDPGLDTVRASGSIATAPFECIQTKEWIAPACSLDPSMAVNRVSTAHTVTITLVRRPGVPAAGVNVTFDVTAGPNAAAVAPQVIMTDVMGNADFTYMGGATPGVDTITATGDVDGVVFNCVAMKEFIDSGCMIQPVMDINQIGTDHEVTITVLRTTPPDTPAVNTIVNFTVTGVNNVVGAAVTDVNGQATFQYTGGMTPGMDTITADTVVDGVPVTCMATKEWVDAACTLTPPNANNPVGSMHNLTATVTNNGAPAAGVLVNFAVTSGPNTGVPIAAALTNAMGQAFASYTSNGLVGTDTIEATGEVPGPGGAAISCTATKTWVVMPTCTIAAMAPSAAGGMQVVTANVERAPGVPATDGTVVNFAVIAGPDAGVVDSAMTVGGTATFNLNNAGGPGVDTITASATVDGMATNCFGTKEWVQPSCTLSPPMAVNRVNTPHTVTITLLRRPGVPAAGVSVTFDVTAGPNAIAVAPQMIVTDANGNADFTYMGGATPGVDTITASGTIEGAAFNCTANKEFINSGCMIDPLMDTNQVGTQHTVTVTVLRNSPPDTPAANAIVNFTVTGVNNAVGAAVTNVNGEATFQYTSNGTPGADTITADTVVDGVAITCNATKNWIEAACSLDPANDTNLVGTNHLTTVTVTENGAPAVGIIVSFNISAGPNAGAADFAVTDGAGQAVFDYTSNGTPGVDTIRASGNISGVPFECTTSKTWLDPQCSLAPPAANKTNGEQHTVTVTVTRDGAAAAGVSVDFNVTAGPNAGLVHNEVTDGAGQAAFTYTGAGGAGTDTIEVSGIIDGIPFNCTATITWQVADGNGIDPDIEDGAPNNGDGNNDGIPDKLQPHVASFPDIFGVYVTIVSPPGTTLMNVMALNTPDGGIPPPDVVFPIGWIKFEVHGVAPGASIVVDIIMHGSPTVNTYYKFGPTPIIPVDTFYRFLFDGTTGSEVVGNIVRLTLVDGLRGDSDLAANGIIVEPGAPALEAENPQPLVPPTCGLCAPGAAISMPLMLIGWFMLRRSRRRD